MVIEHNENGPILKRLRDLKAKLAKFRTMFPVCTGINRQRVNITYHFFAIQIIAILYFIVYHLFNYMKNINLSVKFRRI